MRHYLAWRLAFGVSTPSTNTVVQPEYDDMRPPGVTNPRAHDDSGYADRHQRRFRPFHRTDRRGIERRGRARNGRQTECLLLGISALSVWGGTPGRGEGLKTRIHRVAGRDIAGAIATDAVAAALRAHGVKRTSAVMEPYYPSIESRMQGGFAPSG